jgi:1-phosphatidylinositol-5-phosphate 4-kinase
VKIHIGEEAKAKLLETLTADVEFLTKLHTMDYSLLLGVHDCEAADQEQVRSKANGKMRVIVW